MKAAVFFATREGQTCRIAERIADDLRGHGIDVDLQNVREPRGSIPWDTYDAVCLAASVHIGHHEPEMIAFVRAHRAELVRASAAFVSVTLSQAGAQDAHATPAQRRRAVDDVEQMIRTFVRESGWQPAHVLPVAGALMYRRYNFLIRFIMKRIARKAGASTDASRNYEFTDWNALDRFVERSLVRHADPLAVLPRTMDDVTGGGREPS
jgi:menaquinone-dependent protoporphyrinogen oxidase